MKTIYINDNGRPPLSNPLCGRDLYLHRQLTGRDTSAARPNDAPLVGRDLYLHRQLHAHDETLLQQKLMQTFGIKNAKDLPKESENDEWCRFVIAQGVWPPKQKGFG
ncbi:MAG: hypothetical protein WC685_12430 [Methylobacter sp.]|jgi:hypothetical protein